MTLGTFMPIQAVSAQEPSMYDPSGYVYDASTGDEKTGKRIANASVTLEEWDGGKWVLWDGPNEILFLYSEIFGKIKRWYLCYLTKCNILL